MKEHYDFSKAIKNPYLTGEFKAEIILELNDNEISKLDKLKLDYKNSALLKQIVLDQIELRKCNDKNNS